MTSCWDPQPINRPSMSHVVDVMAALCVFFPGADQPLEYENNSSDDYVCFNLYIYYLLK